MPNMEELLNQISVEITRDRTVKLFISKIDLAVPKILAVVWGLEKFLFYLYGKKVLLYTDHKALEPLIKRNRSKKQYSARLTRWLDRLAHFDISIQHIAGNNLKFTNYLSRNPVGGSHTGGKLRRGIRH